jgi:hypothetical protein
MDAELGVWILVLTASGGVTFHQLLTPDCDNLH